MTSRKMGIGSANMSIFASEEPSVTGRSKYKRVVASIEAGISKGKFPIGERLPPHRELARHFDVTVATLAKAIGDLRRRGILTTKIGSGTFVAGSPESRAEHAGPAGHIDLGLNVPPLEPVERMLADVMADLARSAQISRQASALGYEPIGGSHAARILGADWLKLRGLSASPDEILIVQGAHEGLLAALKTVVRPGDTVLTEALNYSGLRRIADLLQLRLVGIPITGEGLDVEAFSRLARDPSVRAAVLTPVTHNPTATTLTTAQRQVIVAAARNAEIMLIEDDIYGHLTGDEQPLLAMLAPERTILTTSFSKCVAPGIRLGYLAAPATYVEPLRQTLYSLGWSASALQVSLINALMVANVAEPCVTAQRKEAIRRMHMASRLLGPSLITGSGLATYHAWLNLPAARGLAGFVSDLALRGILISPSYHFTMDDSPPPEAVRLALSAARDDNELESLLLRIAAALAAGGNGPGAIV